MTWETKKLHEVANVFSGYAFKSSDMDKQEGIPLIKIKNIHDKKVDKNCETYLNQLAFKKNYQRFFLQKDDFLVAMTGQGSVGRIGKMRSYVEGFLVNQRVGIVRVNKDIADPEFVYQSLATDDTEGMYFNLAMGAGQPNLSPKDIGSANVPFPPLPIQKKIGSLLAAYDDLIENNLKRIKLLEEMAQITYEEWFVRLRFPGHESTPINPETGMPEGWERTRLQDLLVLQRGFDLPTKDRIEGDVPVYASTGVTGFHNQVKVKAPGVMTGRSGTLGHIMYSNIDFWPLNTTLWVKEFKGISPIFAYYLLRSLNFENYNSGVAVPTLNRNDVHLVHVLKPEERIVDLFTDNLNPIFVLLDKLKDQNQRLREARDILLPRLMSGVIDVESYDPAQLLKEAA